MILSPSHPPHSPLWHPNTHTLKLLHVLVIQECATIRACRPSPPSPPVEAITQPENTGVYVCAQMQLVEDLGKDLVSGEGHKLTVPIFGLAPSACDSHVAVIRSSLSTAQGVSK